VCVQRHATWAPDQRPRMTPRSREAAGGLFLYLLGFPSCASCVESGIRIGAERWVLGSLTGADAHLGRRSRLRTYRQPSSGRTSTQPAQKGDSKSGHRPLARRPEHHDPYCRRRSRPSTAADLNSRTGARVDTSPRADRLAHARQLHRVQQFVCHGWTPPP
jgi:hypothetical protein